MGLGCFLAAGEISCTLPMGKAQQVLNSSSNAFQQKLYFLQPTSWLALKHTFNESIHCTTTPVNLCEKLARQSPFVYSPLSVCPASLGNTD